MNLKKIENFIDSEFSRKEKAAKFIRLNELISRGLTDEKIIIDIIKNEKPIPKRLPAELYDKVNYMCRRWMDRIVRFEIDYDFIPDVNPLKNVLICLLESAPVFHSKFIDNHINPYWKVSDYNIDDVLLVDETDDLQRSADDFLLQEIDVKNNVQIKVSLFFSNGKSKLCFAFNHMCMDVGGLKTFLDDLFTNYGSYKRNGTISLFYSDKSRSYERVYDDMSKAERKAAKKLFAAVSSKDKHTLPFTEKKDSDQKLIVRKKIAADIFEPARLKAKEYGATANDLISAAYIRAFYDVADCPETEKVGISCAVDLRRYIKYPENIGYTNHTSFMPCIVKEKGKTMEETLAEVVKSINKSKKDKFMGLHGIPLLNMSFSTMIYIQAEYITSAFYNNANLAVSNIGKIDGHKLSIDGIEPVAIAFVGGAKEKPCALASVVSYNCDLMLSTCFKGNETDRKILNMFFERIEENIKLL